MNLMWQKNKKRKLSKDNSDDDDDDDKKSVHVINNHIYFYCEVSDKNTSQLCRILQTVDNKMQDVKTCMDVDDVKIHLHIKSDGGDLFGAFAIIDKIESIRTPVYTYVEGCAASAATLISVVGKRRFMTKNAYMLIHQLSSDSWGGKYQDMIDDMINSKKFMNKIKNIYKQKTKLKSKELDQILKRDIWWDDVECLKRGLIDEIL